MAAEAPARLEDLAALRAWRAARNGRPVHFVPTMGNLHAGHLELVRAARVEGAAVMASIFVNPTQFGPGEDYERYPRTLGADLQALAATGCDAVWTPDVATMYPAGERGRYAVRPPQALTGCLCGVGRPGHFDGVCNVVMRLLWQVRPDRALFGEKDWQQLVIVRRMVEEFSIPVAIDAVPTARAEDGLALSSRNAYLDADQRRRAPALYRTLAAAAAEAGARGTPAYPELERRATEALQAAGFEPEYVEFRDAGTLDAPEGLNDRLFAAARLGVARLIDNVAVTRQIRR
jgi:pantoate--beta-alanine ligase